ncbi:O-antigen ligase family protein [Geodermatophilus sp. SYSU D01176]
MSAPALSRRVVLAYAPLWLLGAGFLWWPWVLVRLLLRLRRDHRPPLLLSAVPVFLGLSLVLALPSGPAAGRVLGAVLNLTIWIALALYVAGRPGRAELEGVGRGLVDLALVQGVLTLLAWAAYPRFQDIRLPLDHVLPARLAEDPSISAFTTTHLAFLDYFGAPVVRSAGILGNPTWSGSLAALGILLLLVGVRYVPRGGAVGSVLTAGCVAVLVPSLVLAYSRNTVLALVLALAAAAVVALRRRIGPALFGAVVCLALTVLVVALLLVPVGSLVSDLNGARAGSAETRGDIYAVTWERITAAPTPFLGSGIKERAPGLVASLGSHSTYLGLVYRGGFLAAALFLAALAAAGLRAWRDRDGPVLALLVFTAVWSVAEDFDVGHFVPVGLALALAGLHAGRPARDTQPLPARSG